MQPLLVGLKNPHPGEPLAPRPVGCTGWRIFQMLQPMSEEDYLGGFARINLWDAGVAPTLEAIASVHDAVILGDEVWRALRFNSRTPKLGASSFGEHTMLYRVPHPSGRNLWYNDSQNRRAVSNLLRSLVDEHVDYGRREEVDGVRHSR